MGVKARNGEEIEWAKKVVLTCWALWRWKNSEVFEGKAVPLECKMQFLLRSFEDARTAAIHCTRLSREEDELG